MKILYVILLVIFAHFLLIYPAFSQSPKITELTFLINLKDPNYKSYCVSLNTNVGLEVFEAVNNKCSTKKIDYIISSKDQNHTERANKEKLVAEKIFSDPLFVGKLTVQTVSVIGQMLSGEFNPSKAK